MQWVVDTKQNTLKREIFMYISAVYGTYKRWKNVQLYKYLTQKWAVHHLDMSVLINYYYKLLQKPEY